MSGNFWLYLIALVVLVVAMENAPRLGALVLFATVFVLGYRALSASGGATV